VEETIFGSISHYEIYDQQLYFTEFHCAAQEKPASPPVKILIWRKNSHVIKHLQRFHDVVFCPES